MRRVALTALVIGVLVCATSVMGWRSAGMSGVGKSRAALADTQKRVERGRRIVAELPALRARLAATDATRNHWTVSDALRSVTELAAQSGLRVTAIEPLAPKGVGLEAERGLKLRAEGTFGEIRRFFDALGGLPRLVTHDGVQIRRVGAALSVEASLRVFEQLPAVARPLAGNRGAAIDPFGAAAETGTGQVGEMLLVGTLTGLRRAMALIESARGVEGLAPGQMIGSERLVRVHPRSVDMARANGTSRTMEFAEGRR
jgi:Tfp pilus assembly protein PilO